MLLGWCFFQNIFSFLGKTLMCVCVCVCVCKCVWLAWHIPSWFSLARRTLSARLWFYYIKDENFKFYFVKSSKKRGGISLEKSYVISAIVSNYRGMFMLDILVLFYSNLRRTWTSIELYHSLQLTAVLFRFNNLFVMMS